MDDDTRRREIRAEFEDAFGTWREPWDTVLDLDPDFVRAFTRLAQVPVKKSHLTPKFRELCYISVNAAATHLYVPEILPHIQAALDLGATPAEILEVLELASTLGIHAMNIGVPLLVEVMEERGRTGPEPLTEYQESLKAQFTATRGYWHEFWSSIRRCSRRTPSSPPCHGAPAPSPRPRRS